MSSLIQDYLPVVAVPIGIAVFALLVRMVNRAASPRGELEPEPDLSLDALLAQHGFEKQREGVWKRDRGARGGLFYFAPGRSDTDGHHQLFVDQDQPGAPRAGLPLDFMSARLWHWEHTPIGSPADSRFTQPQTFQSYECELCLVEENGAPRTARALPRAEHVAALAALLDADLFDLVTRLGRPQLELETKPDGRYTVTVYWSGETLASDELARALDLVEQLERRIRG